MRPGINRFVSGRRIYARNDIEVVLPVKRSASVTATETSIKVRFAPTDTVFDVYRKLTEATDEVRADISLSAPEKLANTLMRFPRVLLRMAMSIFRLMDYFDWLPRTWLDVSPFHGSVTMLDLGSFGVPPADPHLADFGNMPCAVSFGARRKVSEADGTASEGDYFWIQYFFVSGGLSYSITFAGTRQTESAYLPVFEQMLSSMTLDV